MTSASKAAQSERQTNSTGRSQRLYLARLKRARAKAAFIERVLKDEGGGRVENNWHHLEWLKLAELHKYLLTEAAREHAKTNLLVVGNALYEIGANHNVRILIISDVYEKSQARTRVLKSYIEEDEDFRREFPGVAIRSKKGDEEFTVERERILKEPTVTSTYAGAPISGGRYDLILADDLVNLIKNSQTTEARAKLKRWWYRDVMNSLARGGRLAMLGTPQHSDDLHTTVEQDKRFHVAKYPGVDEEDTGWGHLGYREKNEARGITGDDAVCLWPAMHSYDTHMEKKESQYDEYLSQQQLQSVPDTGLVFRRPLVDAALERGKSVEYDPEAEQYLGIDPGYGKRAAMLAVQERGKDRVEMWAEHSFTQKDDDDIATVAAEHCKEYGVLRIYIDSEDPGLASTIAKHLKRRGLRTVVQPVPFNKYKRLSIKATRWLLGLGDTVAWKTDETIEHMPGRTQAVPSIFRAEIRDYALKKDTDDEPRKENDHGPDAWTAYASKWVSAWLKATGQEGKAA